MEVQIVSKELIKPAFPTTKTFHLSYIDQQYSCCYYKLFLFYQKSSDLVSQEAASEKIQRLKSSLSKVLTDFYPLAGKIQDNVSVSTSEDDGVEFLEARVNGALSKYLAKPNVDSLLPHLIPEDSLKLQVQPLLTIQVNLFTCGGLAIGMNIWHGFLDATTLTFFIKSWANTANSMSNCIFKPEFSGSLMFPPSKPFKGMESVSGPIFKLVTRRFVFSVLDISRLQEKTSKVGSRVQTISAFLWRIFMKMSMSKRSGDSQMPFTLITGTNIRSLLPPPICDQSFGNLIEFFTVPNPSGDMKMTYSIPLIKEKLENLRNKYKLKVLQGETNFNECLESTVEQLLESIVKRHRNTLTVTSWSRFPFYDQDFGWGKPIWVGTHWDLPSFVVLLDTSDGTGIEAWLSIPEEDMVSFASDEELLTYATLDPGVPGVIG